MSSFFKSQIMMLLMEIKQQKATPIVIDKKQKKSMLKIN